MFHAILAAVIFSVIFGPAIVVWQMKKKAKKPKTEDPEDITSDSIRILHSKHKKSV